MFEYIEGSDEVELVGHPVDNASRSPLKHNVPSIPRSLDAHR